ncbi:hypothetical protein [Acrocarpospora phusangensis]|nr:hypothetical protein [Acrocarpospora phusangensis]
MSTTLICQDMTAALVDDSTGSTGATATLVLTNGGGKELPRASATDE